ncbi:MAG: ABC transporter substrate-binding protein, partial [Candidatus Aminicenantes bacterium]|nr:ABC transporter substrate-binding protein [Candidatus Aminicenantes bacterium]
PIERNELMAVPDPTSRVLQLAAGTIDYVFDLPVTASASLPAGVETYPAPHNGQYHVAFNGGLPNDHPLRNARVRQAISLAIDRDEVNQKLRPGDSSTRDRRKACSTFPSAESGTCRPRGSCWPRPRSVTVSA